MRNKSIVLPGETLKWCSKCQTELPLSEFNKNKSRPDGLQNYCKACAYAAYRRSYTKSREVNLDSIRRDRKRSTLKTFYGLSLEEYERMVFDQNNKCTICQQEMEAPHVDVNHVSGQVRAILCGTCDVGLDMFKEDEEMLMKAVSYLSSFKVMADSEVRVEAKEYLAHQLQDKKRDTPCSD